MYECDGQMNIFDVFGSHTPIMTIDKPIRLIEFFAGYGSQALALRELGANFEHYRAIELDKYAMAGYNAGHGTDFEVTDIRDVKGSDLGIVDTDKYTYLLTYSFPCTDLSVAGKGLGMSKGSGTRSGLLWEVERILQELVDDGIDLPQVLLMENVPQVHGKKNLADFESWCKFLESIGYHNFWEDMNAKNYGVAQNRNRTFMVSVLGDVKYEFPKAIPITRVMKDYLEDEVEEKYYINNEKAQKLIATLIENGTLPSRAEQSRLALTSQLTTQDELNKQIALRPDTMQESVISKQTEPVLLKEQGGELEKFTDIASTLMARDYKGFGNQGMNGVIEWKGAKTMTENCCGTCKFNKYDNEDKCFYCNNEDIYEYGLPTHYTDCCDEYEEKEC